MSNNSQPDTFLTKIKSWLEWAAPNKILVLALLVFIYPLGGYLMWKGEHFTKPIRWIITGLLAVWTMVLLSPAESSAPYSELGGDCSAPLTQNGCTYYRDSNCNVIGRSCP